MKPCVLTKENLVKIRAILYWDLIRLVGKNLAAATTFNSLFVFQEKTQSLPYSLVYVRQRNYFNLGRESSNQSFIPTAHYTIWSPF